MRGDQSHRQGFTLIEVLLVLAILAILFLIPASRFIESAERSKVSRIQADQRSLATALASYYVDNDGYPFAVVAGWSDEKLSNNLREPFALAKAIAPPPGAREPASGTRWLNERRPTFAISVERYDKPGGFSSLTTPISYITSYFGDPFSPQQALTFSYLPDGPGFILASFPVRANGSADPERHGDLSQTLFEQFIARKPAPFDGEEVAKSKQFLRVGARRTGGAFTYDPTNGTVSNGSVYRIGD